MPWDPVLFHQSRVGTAAALPEDLAVIEQGSVKCHAQDSSALD